MSANQDNPFAFGVYTTVISASKALLDCGILECESGVYRVADPFFAAYLRESGRHPVTL